MPCRIHGAGQLVQTYMWGQGRATFVFSTPTQRAPARKTARDILRIDPAGEPERARKALDSHLARARWMIEVGYRKLVERDRLDPRDPLMATLVLATMPDGTPGNRQAGPGLGSPESAGQTPGRCSGAESRRPPGKRLLQSRSLRTPRGHPDAIRSSSLVRALGGGFGPAYCVVAACWSGPHMGGVDCSPPTLCAFPRGPNSSGPARCRRARCGGARADCRAPRSAHG